MHCLTTFLFFPNFWKAEAHSLCFFFFNILSQLCFLLLISERGEEEKRPPVWGNISAFYTSQRSQKHYEMGVNTRAYGFTRAFDDPMPGSQSD